MTYKSRQRKRSLKACSNTAAIKSFIENTNERKQPNYQELENEIGVLKEKKRKLMHRQEREPDKREQ